MKYGRAIVLRIVLTVLLTFSLMGAFLCRFAVSTLHAEPMCIAVLKDEGIAEKVYDALQSDFETAYHTTAIPPETYMDAISVTWLETEMEQQVQAYFSYMRAESEDVPEDVVDFTALEESITTFFYDYAEEIDYTPDDAFATQLEETIQNAKNTVLHRMDAFYLQTLEKNGKLERVQHSYGLLTGVSIGMSSMCLLLTAALVLIQRKGGVQRLYWLACALFSAGVLMTIPLGYVVGTDAIAGFTVKDAIVYPSVTGVLTQISNLMLGWSIVVAAAGLVLLGVTIVFRKRQQSTQGE
jgi:hypothetical protein